MFKQGQVAYLHDVAKVGGVGGSTGVWLVKRFVAGATGEFHQGLGRSPGIRGPLHILRWMELRQGDKLH